MPTSASGSASPRTGAPNLPDPHGADLVGERAALPPRSPKAVPQGADASAPAAARAEPPAGETLFIDAVLEQTYRHLFGPTSQPAAPPRQQVVSIAGLTEKLSYLKPADIKLVKEAFHFSDEAHLGQYRQSGEPYITHPVAVAEICAGWKLDVQSIMAALLHDVIEDQGVTKSELAEKFGPKVAELVDGLTKLDKLEFQSREQAQAESFRKMLLAMARDVRVILVKLADRTHNMRTLDHVPPEKRRRIAGETMEIYAPIAHRLGLNTTYRELQELSFRIGSPFRYATLEKAVKAARGNRREVVSRILEAAQRALGDAGVSAELTGREKTLYSIYRKMHDKQLSFSQVLDVYGFRVVVETQMHCYMAVGALHGLYKPMPGKFKDYIAIPKINGYQSVHTTLVGPFGTPVEFQIRTREMNQIAEAGVAAHWMYKQHHDEPDRAQQQAHQWLQSLLDIQSQSGDSQEFLEHVKIDLFPDAVYVFTPKGEIRALPRGATALDFAYAVHSDLGNQCVAVKINNALLPLRTELKNGDIVEVVTAPYSKPNPAWLTFVRTGKARAAIRHFLKTAKLDEAIQLGERLLEQALRQLGIDMKAVPAQVWERIVQWTGNKAREDIFADLALGRRVAAVVARRIEIGLQEGGHEGDEALIAAVHAFAGEEAPAVTVSGDEGMAMVFSPCCRPIPGDPIVGYIGKGEGLQIHVEECRVAKRLHGKDPEHWIDVMWAEHTMRAFDVSIKVLVRNTKGILARVAADLTSADANVAHVSMEQEGGGQEATYMTFLIQVHDRVHLADVMRALRRNPDVIRIARDRGGE
ncbi:bifunctional (p)ppGpp synthetase/guanosine-3',5'-bis(diphosphate) 3'-pyrophosphohydrolase [Ralstonia nicotianae]|uniref:Bifunctional (P)ppGpp synthetase/guanosine-3',5'-bis(Diphosphate) 3'-pyrophosphohydrolase n=1 Tax=Ralstonia pseudosolanacearum TaxID=1310165 RepID=A0A454TU18_9RALS|nr:bifunctional (p)ppGpp synthetase/guanosine-3',5'-bis(diphosphate) 3'-pyrophosphohydrolase [Ralstonia pseudosolanacearum]MCK4132731.1 bifunctional (p)ppGpp synthetase/guanosine-3',5'-bis(diphosphate) 3'-pyrophosphohydrolase [Ralstonia pseudosolanacearum]MDK1380565.1 bifunctional (p)ppGpp synthetase/guanosine-3',5'-bis(diphosphate) 3'-pyrophosphohydrolase [Ralstonia pseudosolanacearum]RAA14173.1 bifunctional (p)ppGpp synthetase/guanosine-3',5'-bis(diphosphate) 3'-pyrophosphohydrolase [Ralstonia